MLSFDRIAFRYEPFPIGLAKPVIAPADYETLVETFPPVELFDYKPELGHKYSLSERNNPAEYAKFIAGTPAWKRLHAWVKAPEFVESTLQMLVANDIDLGLRARRPGLPLLERLLDRRKGLRARFEFSMMPAAGGCIRPHTDSARKIITLVVSMVREGEWDPSFGGGTDVNRPKDRRYAFNHVNRSIDFDEVEVLDSFAFTPNQAVVFIKTFNSWHSVRPMTASRPDIMRRTLTVNIENG